MQTKSSGPPSENRGILGPNFGHAGIGGLGDAIGAFDKNQTWVTQGDTHKFFFVRFMTGIHRRVGEEVRREEPVTIGVLKEIPRIFGEAVDIWEPEEEALSEPITKNRSHRLLVYSGVLHGNKGRG
jgi:hypothetical protein